MRARPGCPKSHGPRTHRIIQEHRPLHGVLELHHRDADGTQDDDLAGRGAGGSSGHAARGGAAACDPGGGPSELRPPEALWEGS
jgi:hypothetical protein